MLPSVTVIKPNIDKVIVVPSKVSQYVPEGKNEPIITEATTGYNVLTGIAILLNQYQGTTHKNFIDIFRRKLTMKLGYNKIREQHGSSYY